MFSFLIRFIYEFTYLDYVIDINDNIHRELYHCYAKNNVIERKDCNEVYEHGNYDCHDSYYVYNKPYNVCSSLKYICNSQFQLSLNYNYYTSVNKFGNGKTILIMNR